MSKLKSSFHCQQCGYLSLKWLGRCPECGAWNSLVEELETADSRWKSEGGPKNEPRRFIEIEQVEEDRLPIGIEEFDRVLGGGVVRGSVTLIGGDPGIGKSTLLLSASGKMACFQKVLYVSGEESLAQIKMRGGRLGIRSENLYLLSETSLEEIFRAVKNISPGTIILDSVQTLFSSGLQSSPGSVSQVKEVASQMMIFSKKTGVSSFLVGHVTKEGAIAGPRVLEHIVDTVLYFEGEKGHPYRILRGVKNRFGSTQEIGVFEMNEEGLAEVRNPSELFLAGRPEEATGSVVVSSLEGSRPILVELQALVTSGYLGIPRRVANGVDPNRLALLLAILEKRGGLQFQDQDIFINVVGGIHIQEPAIDLGIVAAVASSFKERAVDSRTLILGEVGLAGEVRAINDVQTRLNEAAKLGFKKAIIPFQNKEYLNKATPLELVPVKTTDELMGTLFP
ncbi:MAG: DNA repair protein RadA [Nitrospirae bacterium]|nr:DNA repair protein RadA [Nitrospirota bacterium]MBI3351054.1 DNA repair protein RadA [Nitrospirota bacterium]